MPLPSPVVDFPDMSALVQGNRARADSLLGAAWAQMSEMPDLQSAAAQKALAAQEAMQAQTANQASGRGYAEGLNAWAEPTGSAQPSRPAQPVIADSDDRTLLAKTLQAEAGGEGLEGMLAAGAVINNRVRAGSYGDGLRGVIMRPGQFSAWNGVTGYAGGEGALDMNKITPNEAALQAADMLISGKYQDPTGGATHYYNPAVATPKWGQQAGGNWTRIGNHVFGRA